MSCYRVRTSFSQLSFCRNLSLFLFKQRFQIPFEIHITLLFKVRCVPSTMLYTITKCISYCQNNYVNHITSKHTKNNFFVYIKHCLLPTHNELNVNTIYLALNSILKYLGPVSVAVVPLN